MTKTDKKITPLKRPSKAIYYYHPITGNRTEQSQMDLDVLQALLSSGDYKKELRYRRFELDNQRTTTNWNSKVFIHPKNAKRFSLQTFPLKYLQMEVPTDVYEEEKQRRAEQRKRKPKKPDKPDKPDKPKKQKYKKTNYILKRSVGGFYAVVDTNGVDLEITAAHRLKLKEQIEIGEVGAIKRAERKLMASVYGENIIFMTTDLGLAERVAYMGKSIAEVTEFDGFATPEDLHRAKELIAGAGLKND